MFSVGLSVAWWVSYKHNSALIDQTVKANKEYLATAGPLARETIIADRDFNKILPALHRLRYMPAGYGSRATPTPTAATFGLSQRERLQSATENAYRVGARAPAALAPGLPPGGAARRQPGATWASSTRR